MEQKEFTIKQSKEQFRVAKITPLEFLAISEQIDFDNYLKTKFVFSFILQHIEVKQVNTWVKVLEVKNNEEIYWPVGIENNVKALRELVNYVVTEIFKPVFQKSDE